MGIAQLGEPPFFLEPRASQSRNGVQGLVRHGSVGFVAQVQVHRANVGLPPARGYALPLHFLLSNNFKREKKKKTARIGQPGHVSRMKSDGCRNWLLFAFKISTEKITNLSEQIHVCFISFQRVVAVVEVRGVQRHEREQVLQQHQMTLQAEGRHLLTVNLGPIVFNIELERVQKSSKEARKNEGVK
jgi:hypothetical protein